MIERRGFAGLLATIATAINRLTPNLDKAVMQAGLFLEGRIKGKASGRPGPRVRTSNYRRSWNTQRVDIPGRDSSVSVGTNAPQGRRLELGFVGVDALGRTYNQPPFPHVEPALDESIEEMEAIIAEAVDGLL